MRKWRRSSAPITTHGIDRRNTLTDLKRNCPECGAAMHLVRPDPRSTTQFMPYWCCSCSVNVSLTTSERLLLEDAPQLPGMET
jgi:hypothetical protein